MPLVVEPPGFFRGPDLEVGMRVAFIKKQSAWQFVTSSTGGLGWNSLPPKAANIPASPRAIR